MYCASQQLENEEIEKIQNEEDKYVSNFENFDFFLDLNGMFVYNPPTSTSIVITTDTVQDSATLTNFATM